MFRNFYGQTADDAWQSVAAAFSQDDDKNVSTQESRAGSTREILHATISIADPQQRWVVSRTPPINPAFAIAEVIWILSGRNDAAFLNYFNRELPKFSGVGAVYHGAYGHRLRRHFGIDQLDRAYRSLLNNPDSRQVVLQLWDGRCDLPREDGTAACEDIPCNVVSMLKVRSGLLEWTQVMRSNDVYRGLPYNIVQFTTMQEIMAGWLSVGLGSYNHLSDSLHVYEDCLPRVRNSSPVAAASNGDSLMLPRAEFDRVIRELEVRTGEVSDNAVPAENLAQAARRSALPTPYRNMLCVLSAEGARRRQRLDLASEIMGNCKNPLFVQLFSRWISRFEDQSRMTTVSTG